MRDSSSEIPSRFDPERFRRILVVRLFFAFAPLAVFVILNYFGVMGDLMERVATDEGSIAIGPISVGGLAIGWISYGGLAVGLISFGGLSVGLLSLGGASVGIIAIGGGAVGLVAIGGGAVGLLAVGGGALGYIVVGGGGRGTYVLAGGGKGRYVFDLNRQDPVAVSYFCKYLPALQNTFTSDATQSLSEQS